MPAPAPQPLRYPRAKSARAAVPRQARFESLTKPGALLKRCSLPVGTTEQSARSVCLRRFPAPIEYSQPIGERAVALLRRVTIAVIHSIRRAHVPSALQASRAKPCLNHRAPAFPALYLSAAACAGQQPPRPIQEQVLFEPAGLQRTLRPAILRARPARRARDRPPAPASGQCARRIPVSDPRAALRAPTTSGP